jgi:uncharacterized protein
MLKKIFLTSAFIFFLGVNVVFAYVSPGKPVGFVNDFANVMSAEAKSKLEAELVSFEAATKHEIVVVTVKNLGGDYIENFAEQLFKEWGIGKAKADNGVLYLIAIEDRQSRIEVGYGLEGALTDTQTKVMQDKVANPNFKEGRYAEGIALAVAEIEKAVRGEEFVGKDAKSADDSGLGKYAALLMACLFIGFQFIFKALGKSKSFWLGGVLGALFGTVVGVFLGTFVAGFVGILFFGGLGLLFDWGASRKDWFKGGKGGGGIWFLGGGSGGSSGGGFGGFSGGSSGGGGSSSSW